MGCVLIWRGEHDAGQIDGWRTGDVGFEQALLSIHLKYSVTRGIGVYCKYARPKPRKTTFLARTLHRTTLSLTPLTAQALPYL